MTQTSTVLALYLLVTVALLQPVKASAGDLGTESEQDFMAEIDTVISATRIQQPLTEAPASITVIDRNMIVASGAIEIADVLRLVPGVQVGYPQGNQIAVTYHGYGDAFPRDMQILIDGRSIYQPSFADIDWLFLGITLEDIERIEVIRGPNSPFYGSNAVASVINIITRLPLQDRLTQARITAGDQNTRNAVVRHGDRLGELDYRMTLNYQTSSGFATNTNSTNDDREIAGLFLRGTWNPRPNDEVDIQLGLSDGNLGAGAEPTSDPPPHNKDVSSDYQFISWRRALRESRDIRLQLYRNHYDSDDNYRDLLSHAFNQPPAVIAALVGADQVADFGLFDYEGERYDLELQYTSGSNGPLSSVIGMGVRVNRLLSPVITNRPDWIDELSERIFANLSYRASDHLIFNFGALAENSDEFGAHISPRVNISWLFNREHSIRASYARSKRNPSLIEAHFNNVYRLDDGTPYLIDFVSGDPGPETLTSVELGYVGYWWKRKLLFDAKLFWEKTDDYIHFVTDYSIPQPIAIPSTTFPVSVVMNQGRRTVKGGEFQLKYEAAPRDFISLQASVLETDNEAVKDINHPTNPDVLFFPDELVAPKFTISLLASKTLPRGFEISTGIYRMDNTVWLGDGDRIKGFGRIDLRLAKRWGSAKNQMMLEGIVQNVRDPYITFRDENFYDTRAYMRFSLELL